MHEVGSIVEGKVTGITKFGAFVELDDGTVGMVHISEVSQTYVNDISEHLKENQEVKVKILAINDDKKISLSIKKALPQQPRNNNFNKGDRGNGDRNFNRNNNGDKNFNRSNDRNNNDKGNRNNERNNDRNNERSNDRNNGERTYNNQKFSGNNNRSNTNNNSNNKGYSRNAATTPKGPVGFEDMLSKFMSSSEEKMSDIKKPSSNRRGGHSAKRSRDYN